jgi:tellurite resistance protein TerC
MLALAEITTWHWVAFIVGVLLFVAMDLFVIHRGTKVITFFNALFWTAVCVFMAMMFGFLLVHWRGEQEAMEFIAGYIIELSLSMDNVFVIALIFTYFKVPLAYQHRVLFFGFIDALLMRGLMIGIGTALINRFHWILYVMGAFLVFTVFRMLLSKEEGVHPERNPIIRLARKIFPVTEDYHGAKFIKRNGALMLTPLAIVLLMVETTDLIFAVDSIPAIFVVTQKPFIVFTSNIFAILGLRSLYFVLVGAIAYFRYLKFGLSLVLIFIGLKMVLEIFDVDISTFASLMVVAGLILASMMASVLLAKRE